MAGSSEDLTVSYRKFLKRNFTSLNDFVRNLDEIIGRNDIVDECVKIDEKIFNKIFVVENVEEARIANDKIQLFVNETFDSVKIACRDTFRKDHFFILRLDSDKTFKIESHTLPDLKALTVHFPSINNAIDTFYGCLSDLEDYLEVMDDIDTSCWVIDPEKPTSKDNYRRIILGNDVSAMITIDVLCARKPPCIKLLGLSKIVNPLMEKIRENTIEWDIDDYFITNLLQLFDLDHFPHKSELNEVADVEFLVSNMECSICLMDRDMEGLLPSVVCEKATCKQNFHSTCLYQWLISASSVVERFNIIHGECPSCSSPILCSTPVKK